MSVSANDLLLVQKKLKAALRELKIVLEREEVPFWLDFGTLLGAHRNGDMLPWDDDIDICTFETQIKIIVKLVDAELSHIFLPTSTVIVSNVPLKLQLREVLSVETDLVNWGIGEVNHPRASIDVFSIVTVNKFSLLSNYSLRRLLSYSIMLKKLNHFPRSSEVHQNFIRRVFLKIAGSLVRFELPFKEKFKVEGTGDRSFYSINSMFSHYQLHRPKLDKCNRLVVDGEEYSVTDDFLQHLELLYGNSFMKPPPIHLRRNHSESISFTRNLKD